MPKDMAYWDIRHTEEYSGIVEAYWAMTRHIWNSA